MSFSFNQGKPMNSDNKLQISIQIQNMGSDSSPSMRSNGSPFNDGIPGFPGIAGAKVTGNIVGPGMNGSILNQ